MRLFVFDDAAADAWEPFALTRPCGELRYGAMLLRERLERFAGRPAAGSCSRPWLEAYCEEGAPPVVPRPESPEPFARLFLSSRAVPDHGARLTATGDRALTVRIGGEVAGCVVPAAAIPPPPEWFQRPEPLPGTEELEFEGEALPAVWSLIAGNSRRLARDLASPGGAAVALPRGVERFGDAPLRLGPGVTLEPGVLLDTRDGPIRLDERVEVRSGARIAGPLHAGPDCRLLGGPIARLAAGPKSYLRGEIEDCIVIGYSNKAHDGFLGHSYLGRWVNLGALTTNSDLKNNYGPVRLGAPGGSLETGLLKLGCLLGDHVKTAIGTLLDTGTVVGAGANLFGVRTLPKWVPPFAWGGDPSDPSLYRKEEFLKMAEAVLARREVPFDAGTARWLGAVWEEATRR